MMKLDELIQNNGSFESCIQVIDLHFFFSKFLQYIYSIFLLFNNFLTKEVPGELLNHQAAIER